MRIESKKSGQKERREWLTVLASFSLVGVALAGLHFSGVQLCLLNKYIGIPCPVCGSSRALILLLKGRMADAFILQPLATFAMLGAGIALSVYSFLVIFRDTVISLKISAKERSYLFWCAVFLIAANWVYLLFRGVV